MRDDGTTLILLGMPSPFPHNRANVPFGYCTIAARFSSNVNKKEGILLGAFFLFYNLIPLFVELIELLEAVAVDDFL